MGYDKDNLYPQRMRQAAGSSGRATVVLRALSRFFFGGGWKDSTLYKLVVGPDDLTMDKVLRFVTGEKGRALHRGCYLHFNFNGLGQIVSITPLSWEEMRMGEKDSKGIVHEFKHNRDWAEEDEKLTGENTTIYKAFNPDPEVVLNQMNAAGGIQNYTGQVLMYSDAGKYKYPLSVFDPVIEDVFSDSEKKQYNYANLKNNFTPSQALVTDEFKSDEDLAKFNDKLKKFQGARKSNKILHIEKPSTESTFEFKKFEVNDVDKLYTVTTGEVRDSIRGITMIPPILLGDQVPGKLGPAQQEMKDAVNFFNWITADDRLIMEELFRFIFKYWHDQELVKSLDFTILATPYDVGDDQPLAVKLGVGVTQNVKEIITDPLMSPDQKINTLIVLTGISHTQASAMVNGTPLKEAV